MATIAKEQPTFEPPGPGSWDLDALHFPRPVTAYWAQMHPEPFALGYGDMAAFYGLPLKTRQTAYVSGFCYGQMEPLADEEFPNRVQRSAETFERKPGEHKRPGVIGRMFKDDAERYDLIEYLKTL